MHDDSGDVFWGMVVIFGFIVLCIIVLHGS